MPHNAFKNLPVCGGMSRSACLDFRLLAQIVAALGDRNTAGPNARVGVIV
jgi:hypothetical protein